MLYEVITERYIKRPETTVVLVGYQAEGTRGRKLLEGAKEIKMYGKYYPVEANILSIEGLSAHGDQADLLNWLSRITSYNVCYTKLLRMKTKINKCKTKKLQELLGVF